jgi:hypothetical protein
MQAKTAAVLVDRLRGVNHADRGIWENTCLYALIKLGWIEFLSRLTRPIPPAQGGGLRLLIRLAKTNRLGRWRRVAATALWGGAASGFLVHDDSARREGVWDALCRMRWALEWLGCSSGGVGHFWGAFASVALTGGA